MHIGSRRQRPSNRAALPYLVLVLSLLVTIAAALVVRRAAEQQDQLRFDNAVQRTRGSIQTRLDTYLALLRAGSGFFAGSREVERDEFRRFAEQLQLRTSYKGLQGIGYSMRVVPEKRALLIQRIRREGRPSFHIWPEGDRSEYQTIVYLEPVDRRNRAALGFDMNSEPVRAAAMQRARDSGQYAASGKVTLVQEIDDQQQAGFLIYFPVYEGGFVPATVPERREKLRGFIFSPFRADDLLQGIVAPSGRSGIDLKVYDSSTPREDRLLHDTTRARPSTRRRGQPRLTQQAQIVVGGRIWTLAFANRPEFFASPGRQLVPSTLGVGVLVSMLLFAVSRSQVRARLDEEHIAENLRRSERELRAETETLEAVNRIGRILSAELDLQKLVQAVTDAATMLARAEFGVFLYNVEPGQNFHDSFAVSGISRQAFSSTPPDSAVFGPTFRGEGIVRIDDLTRDRHYQARAPFHGIEEERVVVRSYMAIPVASRSGEILGGLFFGHSRAGVFSEREERIVESLAAQAAIAVDNARLYEAAQRDRRIAEEANRAKDDFLATLSHELRTPMTAILGWTRLLETTSLDKETLETALDSIRRSSEAQAQLIDDLLDVSRIAAGKIRLERRPVELGSVVKDAVDAVQPAAESKGIRLEFQNDSVEALMVAGDAGRLQQIVWNLLSNAVKFEHEGGRIIVRLSRRDHEARIEVQDFGQGIDPEFLPHMFKRFRQADASTTRMKGGLGLGLSIVKHLTELHRGTIDATSEGKGKGATFIVSLPLVEPANGELQPERRESARKQPSLTGCDVLVVEDEKDVRQLVAVVLEQAGASLRQAESVSEAMELMQQRPPDVLISDIAMPEEDGFSMMRRIRSSEKLRDLPAVALTAYARPEEQSRILAAGFQKYLQKPVDPAAIIDAVVELRRLKP